MELTLNPINFKENKLGEIPQTITTLFSFAKDNLNGTVDRLHEWVKCRDFLGDVLFSNQYKIPFSIYGFDAHKANVLDRLEFVIKFPDQKAMDNFMNNYTKIIHPVELVHDLKLTDVKPFKNVKELTILLTADKWWTKAIPLLSLYTFLVKVCCYTYTNPEDWIKQIPEHSVEGKYVYGDNRKKLMEKLLLNLRFIFSDFPSMSGWLEEKNKPSHVIHNSSGFYTLFMNMLMKDNYYSERFWGSVK